MEQNQRFDILREMTFRFHRLQPIVRDSLRGVRLSRLKKVAQPTYIDTYIYVRMCVYVCVCVCDSRIFIISLFCILVVTISFFFLFMRVCTYNRYKYKSQANISQYNTAQSLSHLITFSSPFFHFLPFFLTFDRFPHR